MKQGYKVLLAIGGAAMAGLSLAADAADAGKIKNVVLVHGAFVDGSGWKAVYQRLKKDGYNVAIVQNRTTSLMDDVALTKEVIAKQDGPVVLVGHSYGGAVITEAGTDPKVARLVYVAAFSPDTGETVKGLLGDATKDNPPPIAPVAGGYFEIQVDKFHEAFAGDLPTAESDFLANSQLPWGGDAGAQAITSPGWKQKPSWSVIPTEDKTIPPSLQAKMAKRAGATVREVAASHAVYISKPQIVAEVIESAAKGAK
jgi:pimeloyl-ACP methyl ester carboxylesterase